MFQSLAVTGLLGILLSIVFVFLSWWALQMFRIDLFFANPDSPQAKLLMIFLSVLMGYGLTKFFWIT